MQMVKFTQTKIPQSLLEENWVGGRGGGKEEGKSAKEDQRRK